MTVAGLLLAAGAGRRYGLPKALARDESGEPFLDLAVGALRDGGCAPLLVVLGARADEVPHPPGTLTLTNPSWPSGLSSSLTLGLTTLHTQTKNTPAIRTEPGPSPTSDAPAADAGPGRSKVGPVDGLARSPEGLGADVDGVEAVVVLLVDTPGIGAAAVRRMREGAGGGTLRVATYAGVPGHPVVLGREHWAGVLASVSGDEGARGYMRAHGAERVACEDIADGRDRDVRDA
ncbi:nucleotidyltransferase family protein [Actinocorallia lasiicapitis]